MNRSLSDKSNIKWGIILSYMSILVSLCGTLLVTNKILDFVGDYNYGLYSFVNSITAWLTVVSTALTASYVRFATLENKETGLEVSRTNTLYGKLLLFIGVVILTIGSLIILCLYKQRVCFNHYNWNDSKLIYLLGVVSILNISITIPSSVFSLFISYKKHFIFGRIVSISVLILNFAGHYFVSRVWGSVVLISAFTTLISLFTLFVNLSYSKDKLNISFAHTSLRENSALVRSIVSFSSILLLNSVVDQINSNVDKTLLGILSVPENVTIYQLGQQFDTFLVTMSCAVSGVFIPTIHKVCVDKDTCKRDSLFLDISNIQSCVVSLATFGFITCGKEFIELWVGSERIQAYTVACVLMVIDICPLTMNSSIEIQRAENKHLFRAITYLIVAILNIILSIVFINLLGKEKAILGCLVGSVIARICSHWIAMNVYNKKSMKLPVGKYVCKMILHITIGAVSCLLSEVFSDLISVKHLLADLFVKGFIFLFAYFMLTILLDKKLIRIVISGIKE